MTAVVAVIAVIAVLGTGLVGLLALVSPETAFYTQVGAQLIGFIVAVLAVSLIFTVIYLLLFERLGGRAIASRFSLFVGWNLLRSHRTVGTWGYAARRLWRDLRTARRIEGLMRIGLGAALGALILAIEQPRAFNAISAAVSSGFARALQLSCGLVGISLVLWGLPAALAHRAPWALPEARRARVWVTLPTFISIAGVSIGVWALTVVLSVMHGFEGDLRAKILRTNAHIVVEPSGDERAPGTDPMITEPFALQDAVAALPGVVEATAYAHGEVMMASSTNIAVNVVLKGLPSEALETAEQLHERVGAGDVRWLVRPEALVSDRFRYPIERSSGRAGGRAEPMPEPAALDGEPTGTPRRPERVVEIQPGILLGSELAASLNVDVASEIQVITPDGDVGPTGLRPKLKRFRVAGVFTTGMYEYDQKLAYTTLAEAQRFLNLGCGTNRLEARLSSEDRTRAVMTDMRALLAARFPGLEATDWQARNRSLFTALQLERIVMFVVLGFIILVSSLLIVSSLMMLVVEKAKDISVLKALGASDRAIIRAFLVIGGVIGAVGTVSGLTLGVGTCLAIEAVGIPLPKEYYIASLPVEVSPIEVAVVGVAAFAICLLATVYPSLEASAMKPVDGLHHG